MKKMFIFMLMCCTFSQLSAQSLSADTAKIENNETEKSGISTKEISLTTENLMFIRSPEDDEIYETGASDCFRDYRNGQYILVSGATEEEHVKDDVNEDYNEDEVDFPYLEYCNHYSKCEPDI